MKIMQREGFSATEPQIKLEITLDREGNVKNYCVQSNIADVAVDDLLEDEVELFANSYQNQSLEVMTGGT
jgi:hypothetical protein